MKPKINLKQGVLLFLLISILTSCYTESEGCLDRFSLNYDITADNNCDDCCTYPTLSLELNQFFFEDKSMRFDDSLTVDSQYYFKILDFSCYLTNLTISPYQGEYIILDSLECGSSKIANSHMLIKDRLTRYNLHSTKSDMLFDSINFRIGKPNVFSLDKFANTSLDHVFSNENALIENDNLCSFKMTITKGADLMDTLSITSCDLDIPLSLKYSQAQEITIGNNFTVQLSLDYAELFDSVNYNTIDSAMLELMIRQNISNAFYVE